MSEHEYYVDADKIRVMQTPKGSTYGNDQRVVALCATDAGGMDVAVRIAEMLNGSSGYAPKASQPDWRPIKTAPTYETVLVAGGDAIYPVTACWDGDPMDGWYVDGQEDTHVEIGWPTHWMPLPAFSATAVDDGPTLTEEVANLRKVVAESGGLAPGLDERFAASTVEPVAWRVTNGGMDGTFTGLYAKRSEAEVWHNCWSRDFDHKPEIQPLYAAPTTSPEPDVTDSCGNVFADLGVSPEPDAVREALRSFKMPDGDTLGEEMSWQVHAHLVSVENRELHRAEVNRQLDAILAALSRPAHGGWQEIDENTPHDREILAVRIEWWEPENGNHRWIHSQVRQTKWDAERQRFGFDHEKQPTHWTEVPAIPALPIPRNDRGSPEERARAAGWVSEKEHNGEDDGVRHPETGNWAENWTNACAQVEDKK